MVVPVGWFPRPREGEKHEASLEQGATEASFTAELAELEVIIKAVLLELTVLLKFGEPKPRFVGLLVDGIVLVMLLELVLVPLKTPELAELVNCELMVLGEIVEVPESVNALEGKMK